MSTCVCVARVRARFLDLLLLVFALDRLRNEYECCTAFAYSCNQYINKHEVKLLVHLLNPKYIQYLLCFLCTPSTQLTWCNSSSSTNLKHYYNCIISTQTRQQQQPKQIHTIADVSLCSPVLNEPMKHSEHSHPQCSLRAGR